eukprot:4234100-Pyramimonas_sp.AAC.1
MPMLGVRGIRPSSPLSHRQEARAVDCIFVPTTVRTYACCDLEYMPRASCSAAFTLDLMRSAAKSSRSSHPRGRRNMQTM